MQQASWMNIDLRSFHLDYSSVLFDETRQGNIVLNFLLDTLHYTTDRGGLVVRSRLRARRFQLQNSIPLKIHRIWDVLHVKSYVVAKRPPTGAVRKFGDGGVPGGGIQVSILVI
ncbi:hypothetical protein AVEN_30208-1 [Araneus ventricosus]|uniref:Uncharacterized protein n=1 Tax=Araneus ventricosus TaxID=182803 RepID=A0A4Y2F692_ARAVE|nr:hypothetical protein AVEN_30208-1 [Araneus ventricosus]